MVGRASIRDIATAFGRLVNLYLCFSRDVIPISSCHFVLNGSLGYEVKEKEVK